MSTPAERLRDASLRVTKPRAAVLRVLQRHPHAGVAFVADAVREEIGAVSTQAIYDVLAALGEAGLVRRIEPAGSPALFELAAGDNHHHLVCRGCGAIVDVPCAAGAAPCLRPSDEHGFLVDEAEVIYWGRCPACMTEETTWRSKTTPHH